MRSVCRWLVPVLGLWSGAAWAGDTEVWFGGSLDTGAVVARPGGRRAGCDGRRFHGPRGEEEEEEERIYELPSWDPDWRDAPQVVVFPDGGIPVGARDRLIAECTWRNDTDEVLGFPTEMCVLMGLAYPLTETLSCDSGRPQP